MIEIPEDIREQMVSHARSKLPNEACGLLAGLDGRVERYFAMTNADHSAVTYRLDPTEQIRVFTQIEDAGWQLSGIFHSHTHTDAYPSPTDRGQAFYPEAHYVLMSLADTAGPVVRSYRILDGMIEEEEVRIV